MTSLFLQAQTDIGSGSISDSIDVQDIVITASRVSNMAPLTIQNIAFKEIDKLYVGQDPVAIIQQLSPSIVSYSDGGTDIGNYSQFRMRGMDQSRVNITLNGIPLNDMVDHGVYFSNFSDFGNSVESMQITRGVGAQSVGVSSYAGAINFESTNVFSPESSGNLQLTTGSFGTLRTAGELSTGKSNAGFGAYARMTRTETDGYKYNSGSDSYSFFFSGGYLGEKDVLKLTALAGKTQNGQSYDHVSLSDIKNDPRTSYNGLDDIDDFEQQMVQLQYARSANPKLSFSASAYYNGAGGVFPYTFDGSQYMYGLTNDHFGLIGNVKYAENGHSLSGGIQGYIFDRSNFEYISPFASEVYYRDFTDKNELSTYIRYERSSGQLNVYGNIEYRTLSMTIGADESLIDGFNIDEDYAFLNTVIGASFNLSEYSSLYASFGRSGREPTRSDIFNSVLNAEHVSDIELGAKFTKGQLQVDVNGFYMNFDNEIAQIGALQDRSYIELRQNVNNSVKSGIELISKYTFSEQISGNITATYMQSNIDEFEQNGVIYKNVEHVFVPKWIVQPSLNLSPTPKVNVDLSARYMSSSFTELSNNVDYTLPSHFVFNTRLNYSLNEKLKFSLAINNVFNQLYFTEGSPLDVDFDGITDEMGYRIQPPRHFYLMVSYNF